MRNNIENAIKISNQMTVEEYLEQMRSEESENKYVKYSKDIFLFSHFLLTRSVIHPHIDFFCNFCPVVLVISSLIFFTLKTTSDSDSFFPAPRSVILVLSFCMFFAIVTIISLSFLVYTFISMDANNLMSKLTSTTCYIILEFLPVFNSVIFGHLFGSFIRLNGFRSFKSRGTDMLLFTCTLVFVLSMFFYGAWKSITKYKLVMTPGYFSYFSQFINVLDLIVFSSIGIFYHASADAHSISLTPFFLILFLYGAFKIYHYRIPCYMSFVADLVYKALAVDITIYGAFLLLKSVLSYELRFSIPFILIINLLSMFITYLLCAGFTIGGTPEIDFESSNDPLKFLSAIRNSASNNLHISEETFSVRCSAFCTELYMIPDIVRFSLIKGFDLSKISISFKHSFSLETVAIQFLSYQYSKIKTYESKNISRNLEGMKSESTEFWNEKIKKISDFSIHFKQLKSRIRLLLYNYPNSTVAEEVWHEFSNNVLHDDSMDRAKPLNHLQIFTEKSYSTYKYLGRSTTSVTRPQTSAFTKYWKFYLRRVMSPVRIMSFTTLFVAFIYLVYCFSISMIGYFQLFKYFSNLMSVMEYSLYLSGDMVNRYDPTIFLPNITHIMNKLNISDRKALDFQYKITHNFLKPDLFDILRYSPSLTEEDTFQIDEYDGICIRSSTFLRYVYSEFSSYSPSDDVCYVEETYSMISSILKNIKSESMDTHRWYVFNLYIILLLFSLFITWIFPCIVFKKYVARLNKAFEFLEHNKGSDITRRVLGHFAFICLFLTIISGIIPALFSYISYKTYTDLTDTTANFKNMISYLSYTYYYACFAYIYESFSIPHYGFDQNVRQYFLDVSNECSNKILEYSTRYIYIDRKIFGQNISVYELAPFDFDFVESTQYFASSISNDYVQFSDFSFLFSRYLLKYFITPQTYSTYHEVLAYGYQRFTHNILLYVSVSGTFILLSFIGMRITYNFNNNIRDLLEAAMLVIKKNMVEKQHVVEQVTNILESKTSTIIELIPLPALVHNNGVIVQINSKFLNLTDNIREQVVTANLKQIMDPEEEIIKFADKCYRRIDINFRNNSPNKMIILLDITEDKNIEGVVKGLKDKYSQPRLKNEDSITELILIRVHFDKNIEDDFRKSITDKGCSDVKFLAITNFSISCVTTSDAKLFDFMKLVHDESKDASFFIIAAKGKIILNNLIFDMLPIAMGDPVLWIDYVFDQANFGTIYIQDNIRQTRNIKDFNKCNFEAFEVR